MFVIKATYKDETRRLSFQTSEPAPAPRSHGHGHSINHGFGGHHGSWGHAARPVSRSEPFPVYGEVQQKLRDAFGLPSTAEVYWLHAVLHPDESEAQIMFKQHVCTSAEYTAAQQAFRGAHLVSPTLVITVLLSSDPRLEPIHRFHRASATSDAVTALQLNLKFQMADLQSCQDVVGSLERKAQQCKIKEDLTGELFWTARVEEKRKACEGPQSAVAEAREELKNLQAELQQPLWQASLQAESVLEAARQHQIEVQIQNWRLGLPATTFPPLESFYAPRQPLPFQHRAPPAVQTFMENARNKVPSPASTLVATNEIKSMLDTFLANLSNQLANNMGGPPVASPRSATEPEPKIPGAYVDAKDSGCTRNKESTKKIDKGGFRHRSVACDHCMGSIRGIRYKCLTCPDYDLCGTCLPHLNKDAFHPADHVFKSMIHSGLEARIFKEEPKVTEASPSKDPDVRHPATCDVCNTTIFGVRYKCLQCPDWDTCEGCYKKGEHGHASHGFVKVHHPSDLLIKHLPHAHVIHSRVTCDGCDNSIVGPRYKCVMDSCPDYDLCWKCEASPVPVHPPHHVMLKVKTPMNVNHLSTLAPPRRYMAPSVAAAVSESVAELHRLVSPLRPDIITGFPSVPVHEPTEKGVTVEKAEAEAEVKPEIKTEAQPEPKVDNQPEGETETKAASVHTIIELEAVPEAQGVPIGAQDKPKTQEAPSAETLPTVIATHVEITAAEHSVHLEQSTHTQSAVASELPVTTEELAAKVQDKEIVPLNVEYLGDTTICVGQKLPAGSEFDKTWFCHFTGLAPGQKLTLRFQGGESFGTLGRASVEYDSTMDALHYVTLGDLQVPTSGESFFGVWQFFDEEGHPVGSKLWIDIKVEDPASDEKSLSSSSIVMPSLEPTPRSTLTPVPATAQSESAPAPADLFSPSTAPTEDDEVRSISSTEFSLAHEFAPTENDGDSDYEVVSDGYDSSDSAVEI